MGITRFANPELLVLLGLLPLMLAYYLYRTRQGGATLQVSTTAGIRGLRHGLKYYLRHVPFVLETLACGLIVVALARPQSSEAGSNSKTKGIDIVLSLDISGSMLARDFKPDRITAAKMVAQDFILERPNDRIGLVVFAGESFTQSPLTTDKATLINLLNEVHSGLIEDGTAIGNGLATAVNRLKESAAKSKVLILLTDGVNNRGQIAPLTAAEIAKAYGIKVYTIGVGSMGMAPYPAIDMWGNITFTQAKVEIDEKVLTEIAEQTGGTYFRATDARKLKAIYDEINTLERTEIEVEAFQHYQEKFMPFVLWSVLLLVGSFLMRQIYLKRIP